MPKKDNNETVTTQTDAAFGWIEQIIVMCSKYGWLKIIFSVIMMVFISYAAYIAFNPSIMFEKYIEYVTQKHSESIENRLENSPLIQAHLENLLDETGALRAYIIEMHNGKNNPTGLSFVYGSLNYEAINDTAESVMEDYSDFSLERFPVISKVHNETYWEGSIEQLLKVDKKFGHRVWSNDGKYVAIMSIYGINDEIGFLGITFGEDMGVNKSCLKNIMTKYSMKISPLLDAAKFKR